MKHVYSKTAKNSLRTGLTLIEVVASIALLALLMVLLLGSWQRHRKLMEQSQQKTRAVELLDEQMGRWFAIDGGPPLEGSGFLSDSDYRWSTAPTLGKPSEIAGLIPVTVQVSSTNRVNLTSVEVVVAIRGRFPSDQPVAGARMMRGDSPR